MSRVVANQSELARIGGHLLQAKWVLEADLLANLLSHPIRNALLELEVLKLIRELDELHGDLQLAERNLFGTETQLAANHYGLLETLAADASVALAFGLQQFAATKETGVNVALVESVEKTFVSNRMVDYVTRLQMTASGEKAAIRIDLNTQNGFRQFTVYIPGTQVWNPIGSKNPLDVRSAVETVARPNFSAAERAVAQAIKQAGVRSGDKVILVGHSLGGAVAANLAASRQNFTVNGLITVGSPSGRVALDPGIRVLNIGHSNDLVTYVDGEFSKGVKNENAFNWQSEAPKNVLPAFSPVPEHELENYRTTAETIDRSANQDVAKIRDWFLKSSSGEISSQTFEIKRLSN